MSELGLPSHLRLGPRIGRGRQAVVHEGVHRDFGEVAVKLMEGRAGLSGERSLRRFMREASLAQRVDHPCVLRILEAGEVDFGAYLVMERLRGFDLAEVLKRVGPFPVEALVEVGVQTARALVALDAAGVLHRDVKPENLFLHSSAEGTCVKLTDLGVGTNVFRWTCFNGPCSNGITLDDVSVEFMMTTGISTTAQDAAPVFRYDPRAQKLVVDGTRRIEDLMIMDALGRSMPLNTGQASERTWNVGQYPSGLYVLRALVDEKLQVFRFVVER